VSGALRCWARLRNMMSEGARDVVILPSEHSARRVNIAIGDDVVASVDVFDLVEAIREIQHVRRNGKPPDVRFGKDRVILGIDGVDDAGNKNGSAIIL
jgi:cytosine/adenosine deaminase-related metal-dependent hydrolase